MRRTCVHEPTCCFSFREPGTDSSLDLRPRAKLYTNKRRPACPPPYGNAKRHYKRKDPLANGKHVYPCVQALHRYRLSNERSVPALHFKSGSQKLCHCDESSTEARSASSLSQCTSGLSVDVSCEMAAVNREIDAMLSRFERSMSCGDGPRQCRQQLTAEQLKLMAMERPPLDRLHELPLDCLKPRKPGDLRENLCDKVANKLPSLLNGASWSKGRAERKPSGLAQGPPDKGQPAAAPRTESAEMLARLWEDMRRQGLIPEEEEVGKNVRKIYTNMRLDEESHIPQAAKQEASRGNVSTQTNCDFEALLSKGVQPPKRVGRGAGDPGGADILDDKRPIAQERTKEEKPPEKKTGMDGTGTCSPKKKTVLRVCEQSLTEPASIVIPPKHKEINVYTSSSSIVSLNRLTNLNAWYQGKECSEESLHLQNKYDLSCKPLPEMTNNQSPKAEFKNQDERVPSFPCYTKDFDSQKETSAAQKLENENEGGNKKASQNNSNSQAPDQRTSIKNGLVDKSKIVFHTSKNDKSSAEDTSKPSVTLRSDSLKGQLNLIPGIAENVRNRETLKKENSEKLEPSICVELIKKKTESMMKCHQSHVADQFSTERGVIYLLKQIRTDLLKHIQTEVKHIEDLDRCLENCGMDPEANYSQHSPNDKIKKEAGS